MTLLVPAASLEANLGALGAEDTTRAESFLSEASDLAREIGSAAWTDIESGNPAPMSVRLAVKRAATRAFTEDADGYSQESLGEWSGSKKTGLLDETGVFFTANEIRVIRVAAGKSSGARSITTPSAYVSDTGNDTLYAPVAGEGSPFPLLARGE